MNDQLRDDFGQLENALQRLREALEQPESNPLAIDGTIQRFEFSIELFWKLLKHLLQQERRPATTPKQVLRAAYSAGWLEPEELWLDMLDDRNASSHTYRESIARRIYGNIQRYYPVLAETLSRLETQFKT